MEVLTFEQLPSKVALMATDLTEVKSLLGQLLQKAEKTEEPDRLLTVIQAAEFLSLSVPTIYGLIQKGEIPAMKRSKRVYFSKVELINYLKQGRKKTLAETASAADQYLSRKKKGGCHE